MRLDTALSQSPVPIIMRPLLENDGRFRPSLAYSARHLGSSAIPGEKSLW